MQVKLCGIVLKDEEVGIGSVLEKITTPIIELYPETAGERKLCIRGTIVKVVGFTGEEFKDLKVEIQYPPTPCWLAKDRQLLGGQIYILRREDAVGFTLVG